MTAFIGPGPALCRVALERKCWKRVMELIQTRKVAKYSQETRLVFQVLMIVGSLNADHIGSSVREIAFVPGGMP